MLNLYILTWSVWESLGDFEDFNSLIAQSSSKHSVHILAAFMSTEIMRSIKKLYNTISRHEELPGVFDSLAVPPSMHIQSLYWNKDDGNFQISDYKNFYALIVLISLLGPVLY